MKNINILLVDDHRMVLNGLTGMLKSIPEYNFIIDCAMSASEAIEKVRSGNYHIILMDYKLPDMNGAEAIVQIVKLKQDAKILAMSGHDEYEFINNMIKAGSFGFISKGIEEEELLAAIETVMAGKHYYSKDMAAVYINGQAKEKEKSSVPLTAREKEILMLIAAGFSNKQAAGKLNISEKTVKDHRKHVMKKLKAKNAVDLVSKARKLGVI